jgi:hypothetical protein
VIGHAILIDGASLRFGEASPRQIALFPLELDVALNELGREEDDGDGGGDDGQEELKVAMRPA